MMYGGGRTCCAAHCMEPLPCVHNPAITLNKLLFPHPEGPMISRLSPTSTENDRSSATTYASCLTLPLDTASGTGTQACRPRTASRVCSSSSTVLKMDLCDSCPPAGVWALSGVVRGSFSSSAPFTFVPLPKSCSIQPSSKQDRLESVIPPAGTTFSGDSTRRASYSSCRRSVSAASPEMPSSCRMIMENAPTIFAKA